MKLNMCVLAAMLALAARGSEIPETVLPAGVGVNIHFVTGHARDLDMIAAAGFRFVRMDFLWQSVEAGKGQYDWTGYEALLANLDKRGLRAILILDYSHSLYEERVTSPNPLTGVAHRTIASPRHPESIEAFARWAAASAKHFHGRHVLWEIWNEPNGNFWSPKPDAQEYAALALATARAIRDAEPQATIIGPASASFPWAFLETLLKSGVLEYLDAVSVHPYRDPRSPPETAAADYEKLRGMIERYAPAAKRNKLPILSGEWGYSTWKHGVSLEAQAAFAVRQQLANLLSGVPLSIWYDWKNDGDDSNENEHNFGTVLPDLTPKPAYIAIRTLTHELSGYSLTRRIGLAGEKDYVLLCTGATGPKKLVAWTVGDPHPVRLGVSLSGRNRLTGAASDGGYFTPKVDSGELVLDLGSAPQYVTLHGASLR